MKEKHRLILMAVGLAVGTAASVAVSSLPSQAIYYHSSYRGVGYGYRTQARRSHRYVPPDRSAVQRMPSRITRRAGGETYRPVRGENIYPGLPTPPPRESVAPTRSYFTGNVRGGERPYPTVAQSIAPSPVQVSQAMPHPYQPREQWQDYNQAGGVSQATAERLLGGEFAKGQPQQAMRSLLGTPRRLSETREEFPIRGTGDQVRPDQRLIIDYDPNTGKAINWRKF